MPRYFVEVAYKGTNYAGFQIQANANTIQAEIENALHIYFRQKFELTGSSRTDAGVHAMQNFFHFDTNEYIEDIPSEAAYHLNAILPKDIVVKSIIKVGNHAHCRFDAKSRSYEYTLYQSKDPFIEDIAYYYPYPLSMELLNKAALIIKSNTDFQSFAKKNTQVQTFECTIMESTWVLDDNKIIYKVKANRFLRGMVKGLVGTMLKVATGKINIGEFEAIIKDHELSKVDFSTPSQGLSLVCVCY